MTTFTLDDIYEELSYSMSQPEADNLRSFLDYENYKKASKFLLKFIPNDKTTYFIDTIKQQNQQDLSLVEISINAMTEDKTYVLRIGMNITKGFLITRDEKKRIFANNQYYELHSIKQVWNITEKL